MNNKLAYCGMIALAVSVFSAGAEAKLIRYEIDGKQYSYSTNNIQQTKEARRRIEAANAARGIKAKAEEERTTNPLVRLFGSPAQREAAEAQARVDQAVAGAGAELESTSSIQGSRASRRSSRRAKARAERKRPVRVARVESKPRFEAPVSTGTISAARSPHENTPAPAAQRQAAPSPKLPPVENARAPASAPQSALSFAEPRESSANSLMDFVNQVRKAPPETASRF